MWSSPSADTIVAAKVARLAVVAKSAKGNEMCIAKGLKVESPNVLVGFKVMEQTKDGYRPVFFASRNNDHRIFVVGIEYRAIDYGRWFNNDKACFHALSSLADARKLLQEIRENKNWTACAQNATIVCVQLRDEIMTETVKHPATSLMNSQFSGENQTILFKVE